MPIDSGFRAWFQFKLGIEAGIVMRTAMHVLEHRRTGCASGLCEINDGKGGATAVHVIDRFRGSKCVTGS